MIKKIISLIVPAALILCSQSAFAQVIVAESQYEPEVDMTITAGGGSCGDNVSWTLTEDGVLTVSGTGKMKEYAEGETLPWFEKNAPQAILNVTVEDGVESVCAGAFKETSIVSLVLPDSVTQAGEYFAALCKKLEYVRLPDGMERLPDAALAQDKALTYVHLPSKLKYIGISALGGAELLESVIIPEGVTEIGERAFAGCSSLKKVVIPPGVKTLEYGAFRLNISLTELYLPPSLEVIGDTAMSGCPNIDKIILPETVKEIEASAFAWADLKRQSQDKQIIYIPKSVSTFGLWAVHGSGIEIHGAAGSEAETFAKNADIEFVAEEGSMYSEEEYNAALKNQTETVPEIPTQSTSADKHSRMLDVMSDAGMIVLKVEGKPIEFDDAEPFVDENGRTQIPVRAVAEVMDCEVDWDGTSETVTLTKGDNIVKISIGSAEMTVGDKTVTMDTAARIVNDRTYIPVRYAGEALGLEVNWVE